MNESWRWARTEQLKNILSTVLQNDEAVKLDWKKRLWTVKDSILYFDQVVSDPANIVGVILSGVGKYRGFVDTYKLPLEYRRITDCDYMKENRILPIRISMTQSHTSLWKLYVEWLITELAKKKTTDLPVLILGDVDFTKLTESKNVLIFTDRWFFEYITTVS